MNTQNFTPQYGFSYEAPAPKTSNDYDSSADWLSIIQALGQGTSGTLQNFASPTVSHRREAKESRRRVLANLLNASMRKNQGLFRLEQENAAETAGTKANALQHIARGFIGALQGST